MSQQGAERRRWPRIPASALSGVSASIVSGPEVKLVNLSRGGALVQVGSRYPVRSYLRLKLTRASGEITIAPGTVAWAKVSSIVAGQIHYIIAITFEQPIGDLAVVAGVQPERTEIESPAPVAQAPEPTPAPAPANLTPFPSPVPAAKHPWEEEKARLLEELADATTKSNALQAALESRERHSAQALADQQAKYEALIAELMKTANDQQAEFDQMLAEAIAARDQALAQVEQLEARDRAIRQEAARLAALITAPAQAETAQRPGTTFQPREGSSEAVA